MLTNYVVDKIYGTYSSEQVFAKTKRYQEVEIVAEVHIVNEDFERTGEMFYLAVDMNGTLLHLSKDEVAHWYDRAPAFSDYPTMKLSFYFYHLINEMIHYVKSGENIFDGLVWNRIKNYMHPDRRHIIHADIISVFERARQNIAEPNEDNIRPYAEDVARILERRILHAGSVRIEFDRMVSPYMRGES